MEFVSMATTMLDTFCFLPEQEQLEGGSSSYEGTVVFENFATNKNTPVVGIAFFCSRL